MFFKRFRDKYSFPQNPHLPLKFILNNNNHFFLFNFNNIYIYISLRRHLQIRTFIKQPAQSSNTRPINKFVIGYTNNFVDTRLNSKNDKLNSSSHTDNKKNLAVVDSNQGKFQTNAIILFHYVLLMLVAWW